MRGIRCTSRCEHVDPEGPWDHETKLQEDQGLVHTDDCIEICIGLYDDDDFQHCTAGQPGSKCRVKEGK